MQYFNERRSHIETQSDEPFDFGGSVKTVRRRRRRRKRVNPFPLSELRQLLKGREQEKAKGCERRVDSSHDARSFIVEKNKKAALKNGESVQLIVLTIDSLFRVSCMLYVVCFSFFLPFLPSRARNILLGETSQLWNAIMPIPVVDLVCLSVCPAESGNKGLRKISSSISSSSNKNRPAEGSGCGVMLCYDMLI
jgi:hypothetical protein